MIPFLVALGAKDVIHVLACLILCSNQESVSNSVIADRGGFTILTSDIGSLNIDGSEMLTTGLYGIQCQLLPDSTDGIVTYCVIILEQSPGKNIIPSRPSSKVTSLLSEVASFVAWIADGSGAIRDYIVRQEGADFASI